ncbi:hypothetical protein VPH35_092208 [Triticum aestivum]
MGARDSLPSSRLRHCLLPSPLSPVSSLSTLAATTHPLLLHHAPSSPLDQVQASRWRRRRRSTRGQREATAAVAAVDTRDYDEPRRQEAAMKARPELASPLLR